jgi:small subunit ribosomal protein S13
MGLTSVKGVGVRTALAICEIAGVDKNKLGGHLTDAEQDLIREAIVSYPTEVPLWMLNRQRDIETGDELHLFSVDVGMTQDDDIARLRSTKAYRGLRHAAGKRVRGQRTRSNGRTGLTLGVQRKKA